MTVENNPNVSKRTARRRRRQLTAEQKARANAEYQRAWRDRKRGGPPRKPKACGTFAAYRRHIRNGEPVDDACREAFNSYTGLSIRIGDLRSRLEDGSAEDRARLRSEIDALVEERNQYK